MEELLPAQRAVIVQRYYLGMSEAEMPRAASLRRARSSRALTPHARGSRGSCARTFARRAPRRRSTPYRILWKEGMTVTE